MTSTAVELPELQPKVGPFVWQLARSEMRRSVRNPIIWLSVAGSLWLAWVLVGGGAPILPRDSVFITGSLLPLAAASLLVANLATLRERSTEEGGILDSLPNPALVRTGGLLAAAVGPAVVAAVIELVVIGYLLLGGPVGQFLWLELISGPVIVAVAWCGGVTLARWAPSGVVAPMVLLVLAFLNMLASPDVQMFDLSGEPAIYVEWLALWAPPSSFAPPEAMAFRPVDLRLVYLTVLLIVLVTVSIARHLKNPRRLVAVSAAVGILVVAVVPVVRVPNTDYLGPPTFDWVRYLTEQPCETLDGIDYCAFDLYQDWVPHWQQVVARVQAVVPAQPTKVIQRPVLYGIEDPTDATFRQPGIVVTTTEWDRPGATPIRAFELATVTAFTSVGLPTLQVVRPFTDEEKQNIREQNPDLTDAEFPLETKLPHSCSATGQARAAVALWAGMQAAGARIDDYVQRAVEQPRPYDQLMLTDRTALFGGATVGRSDALVALELADMPIAEVGPTLAGHWNEITDPSTTTRTLAGWFGIATLENPGELLDIAPCP